MKANWRKFHNEELAVQIILS